jgi:hypothetical protein
MNMENEIDGEEELNELFKSILGTDVKIKDNISVNEQLLFASTIQKLEDSHKLEESLLGEYGISISQITDPLWDIIENNFSYIYGEQAQETIMWYIYHRFDPDGSIIPLEEESGKVITLKDVNDLWSYIKYKVK